MAAWMVVIVRLESRRIIIYRNQSISLYLVGLPGGCGRSVRNCMDGNKLYDWNEGKILICKSRSLSLYLVGVAGGCEAAWMRAALDKTSEFSIRKNPS